MPRAGLDTDQVVTEAAELADEVGLDQLTQAALAARLGVRQPSLYNHVGGSGTFAPAAHLHAGEGRARRRAGPGRHRPGSRRRPGRDGSRLARLGTGPSRPLQAAERGATPGDAEHEAVARRAVEVMAAVMDGYGIHGEDAIDAIRAFRAALHRFVSLEANHGFAFPASVDRSFDRLVHALARALSSWTDVSQPGHKA